MRKLLWAEWRKLRRSSIILLTIFATVLIAVIVLVAGRETTVDGFYLNDAGWYMTMVQPWATMFVLPAIIAMLGSYMICREEQDDTLKSLLLIPVSETALTAAKMIVTFVLSVLIYLLLFVITLSTELILHYSDLSIGMVLSFFKSYLLEGVGGGILYQKELLAGFAAGRNLFFRRIVYEYVQSDKIFLSYYSSVRCRWLL